MKKKLRKENNAVDRLTGAKKKTRRGKREIAVSPEVSFVDLGRVIERYGVREVMPRLHENTPEEVRRTSPLKKRMQEEEGDLDLFGERDEEEREPLHKKTAMWLTILALILVIIGALVALYYTLVIQKIEVSGNAAIGRAEILTTAGINIGEHMWLADLRGAKETLLADPYIKSAAIKRVYPNTLRIVIVERTPLAAIRSTASTTLIDGEGYVLDIQGEGEVLNLIQVYGMGSQAYSVGQKIDTAEAFNSATLLSILSALESAGLLESIESVDVSQPLSIMLSTHSGYSVHLGQPDNVEGKLANLSKVLTKVTSMGYAGGIIDVAVLGDPAYSPPESLEAGTSTDLPATSTDLPEESPQGTATPGNLSPEATPDPATNTGEGAGGFSG